jgi:hypothetical protein
MSIAHGINGHKQDRLYSFFTHRHNHVSLFKNYQFYTELQRKQFDLNIIPPYTVRDSDGIKTDL